MDITDGINKGFAVFIILTMAVSCLSLLMVKPANAQTIPTPSVPEFTVKLADHSYDVPPSTFSTTDPYTNKTTTINYPSTHVQNFTIEITITNQPFPSIINGDSSILYYNLREKPHFGQEWAQQYYQNTNIGTLKPQSNSGFTVISFPIDPANFEAGNQIDYQVQAILGYNYITYEYGYKPGSFFPSLGAVNKTAYVSTSDWSPTQTFIMPDISPTPKPFQQNVVFILPIAVVLAVVIIFSLLLFRRHRKIPLPS